MNHPSAIIHPRAKVDATASVGAYSIIDEAVEVGPYCVIGPQVYLTGRVVMGSHNQFHAGCVIGDAPQDLKYDGEPTRVTIGAHNVFREHVTVHRSNSPAEDTVIGSGNFLMANSHVGHNCRLGNQVVLANGALLGGHVSVGDRAFVSGNCLAHQFVRIGALALMQGGAAISKDLPPYTVARGDNGMCGLNVIGLRRAGLPPEGRGELKRIYRMLFRSGLGLDDALEAARREFASPESMLLLDFVATSKRGICRDTGRQALKAEGQAARPLS